METVAASCFFQQVDDFFDYRKDIYQISPQTEKSNRIDLALFQKFVENKNIQNIDGNAAMKFQYYLKKERENCGASINRKIFTLRSYANHLLLAEVENALNLPFDKALKIKSGYRNQPEALEHQQIKTLFEHIERDHCLGIRDYAVYACMYGLGLRVGEVHTLNLQSLDMEKKKIIIMGKGNKKRKLPLNKEMYNILAEWLAVRDNFLNSDKSQALFLSKKGNRLAIRTMEDNFNKILVKAKLNADFNVSCHTLRHSFATHLNENGEDILVIQSLMGHASSKSAEIYIHPSREKIKNALDKLPVVLMVKKMMEQGKLNAAFQDNYKVRKE